MVQLLYHWSRHRFTIMRKKRVIIDTENHLECDHASTTIKIDIDIRNKVRFFEIHVNNAN